MNHPLLWRLKHVGIRSVSQQRFGPEERWTGVLKRAGNGISDHRGRAKRQNYGLGRSD